MAVMSFVQDAIHIVVSGVIGLSDKGEAGSTDCVPKLLAYAMPRSVSDFR